MGLGANLASPLGGPEQTLAHAVQSLALLPLTSLQASSRLRITQPVGPIAQPSFLNAVVLLRTLLTPRGLLAHLHAIELTAGRDRTREQRWGPRTLDLDLLLYGDVRLHEPGLTIPHPRMHERRFVLEPLAELWPDAPIFLPTGSRTASECLAALGHTQA